MDFRVEGIALENGSRGSALTAKERVWSEVVITSGIEVGKVYWVAKWYARAPVESTANEISGRG